MTKLMEWLGGLVLILGLWLAILLERTSSSNATSVLDIKPYPYLVLLWPIGLVAAFGIYSVAVIAPRVYDFNDCQEAAEELRRQIKEAKTDLRMKGLECDS
jgi:dolichyl-phosphate mannosyltransferase polypeptide 3